jgi:O-antigen/teichoic acid export membrane protein
MTTVTAAAPGRPARARTTEAPARRLAGANAVALVGALVSLSIASLVVAHLAGPDGVGIYALLRVLPWLVGVVISSGLPMASAYVVSSARVPRASLNPTITAIMLGCGAAGTLGWLALSPVLRPTFFSTASTALVALSAPLVLTQLVTVTGKACAQGGDDLPGSNAIIFLEEFLFLPGYGIALAAGLRGTTAVVTGLLVGGAAAAAVSMGRMAAKGFFGGWSRPTREAARELSSFGARGQLGNLLWLMNLRLDFLILGAIAGPATLGVYAVASKAAELMRLPATAANYVLYPRFSRLEPREAAKQSRHLLNRAAVTTAVLAPLVAVACLAIPTLFGQRFHGAVVPAVILVLGLAPEGAAAVSSAYLCGSGRPGLNSLAMGIGLAVTVVLDVALIPAHHAIGAAIASTAAYLTTTSVLVFLDRRQTGEALA